MSKNIKEIISKPVGAGAHDNIHYFVMIIFAVGKPVKLRLTELLNEGVLLLIKNTTENIPFPEEVISELAMAFPDSIVGITLEQLKVKCKVNTKVAIDMYNKS